MSAGLEEEEVRKKSILYYFRQLFYYIPLCENIKNVAEKTGSFDLYARMSCFLIKHVLREKIFVGWWVLTEYVGRKIDVLLGCRHRALEDPC